MATINIEAEKRAYKRFLAAGMTPAGACGLIGNLEAESDGFYCNRVEYLCLRRLKEAGKIYTDESYTKAIDFGKISCESFLHPIPGKQYGFGLAQWTSPGRKAGLWTMARDKGVSIADEDMQLSYLLSELQNSYPSVLKILRSTSSIREASDIVLKKFEMPANTGEAVCAGRAARGQRFYDTYVNKITKAEKATRQMEAWANDDAHGYDQIYRWGERGDYDCSAAVIQAWQNAGVPVKSSGATYTGNMLPVFLRCGFVDVTASVNRSTGAGLSRGDVLLNTSHHTAMYCGSNKEVEASINEKGTATGGKPGDQTGREFLIRSYRNYPWTHVLRYVDQGVQLVPELKPGMKVQLIQAIAIRDGVSSKAHAAGYVPYTQLSTSAKKKASRKGKKARLKSGTVVGVLETRKDYKGDTWIRIKSGWLPVIVGGKYRVTEA